MRPSKTMAAKKTRRAVVWRDVSGRLPNDPPDRLPTAWEVKVGPFRLLVVRRRRGPGVWEAWCEPFWNEHAPLPASVANEPHATRAKAVALAWRRRRLRHALAEIENVRAA